MDQNNFSIRIEDLPKILEPLIRRVVREELNRFVRNEPERFVLEPDMPLYEDLQELALRKATAEIELYSHREVWGE